MRAAVLTLIFAPLVATRPASADVQGDVTAGVAGGAVSPQIGLRGRVANDSVGAMLGADWTYVRGFSISDGSEYRDRFRLIASLVLPFEIDRGTTLSIRLGAGVELARLTRSGGLPFGGVMPGTSHDRDLGMAYEGALGLFHDIGGVALGGELGLAVAMHDASEITRNDDQRNELFVRFVGRFAR